MRKALTAAAVAALMALVMAPGTAMAQKETKISGVIAARSGASMLVRTSTGTTTVTLNDATKVASNTTADGQAENRRVVVTIVVNRGVAGS